MSVIVNCPHCGKPATVNDSQYRGALTCPSCKKRFWLTLGAPANAGPSADVGPSHLLIDCPKCHAQVKFAKTLLGRLGRCPSCQELVKLDPHAAKTESAARVPERNVPTRAEWREALSAPAAREPKRNEPTGAGRTHAKSALSKIGTYALGVVIMLAVLSIPAIFLVGGIWVAEKILPWLILLCILALAFNIVILGPLAAIPATRPWAGLGFYISSYLFGLTGWFMGLLLTWILWGGCAVVVGLFILGIGVVPIAMLATLVNGMWLELGLLVLAVVLTYGLRVLGAILANDATFAYHRLKRAAAQEPTSQELPVFPDPVSADKERDRGSAGQASDDPANAQLSASLPRKAETMNSLQKAILAVGGVVLLANLFFPPWQSHNSRGFIFWTDKYHYVDWSILAVTSLAIVVGTGVLFGLTVLFKKPRAN